MKKPSLDRRHAAPQVGWASGFFRGLVVLLLVFATSRLIWLQAVKGTIWRVQAEGNRQQRVTVRSPRGLLVDRHGRVVARNQMVYVEPFVDEHKRLRERVIAPETAVQLQATQPATLKKMYVREYPYGPVLSHLLGYTSGVKTSTDPVLGEAGIEKFANQRLSGHDGEVWYERSAQGRAQRILAEREPQAGETISLTLDAELSALAYRLLGEQAGSVVITTPKGHILAAVSTPSFLPRYPDQPGQEDTDAEQWGEHVASSIVDALQDERSPLLFRAVGGVYPPGSVFKIVTALAGLERGAITESTTVEDQGVLTVGEFRYQNWYWRQYGRVEGTINVVRALGRSNDIFFYRLAEWVGPESLAEFARWFGFAQAAGIEGQREQLGLVPDPAWKQRVFGERWYLGNTFHMGIGQGDVLVTPVQVQVMMNTVATRGRQCELRVLADTPAKCQEISLQPATWEAVEEGLHAACAPGGTAFPFFDSPYDVICKTGTAEFGAADHRGFRPTHGWFTAAVSSQPRSERGENFEPEYIITVMVESDDNQLYKEGSREAAPLARELADYLILGESAVQEDTVATAAAELETE